jgi:hypothetical protein
MYMLLNLTKLDQQKSRIYIYEVTSRYFIHFPYHDHDNEDYVSSAM